MEKPAPFQQPYKSRFTRQFRVLGIIGTMLVVVLLLLGLNLLADFDKQIALAQANADLSLRPVTQLQRQLLMLILMVERDPALFDAKEAAVQIELVGGQFNYVRETQFGEGAYQFMGVQIDKAETLWGELQPDLEVWQANPQDRVFNQEIEEQIRAIEFIINDIATDSANERRVQTSIYLQNTADIIQSLLVVMTGILILAVIAAITTYYFIRERQIALIYLQRTNDELELRVAERTQDLQAINGQLEQEIVERKQTQEDLRVANDRLQADLQLAQRIQQGLLPSIRPIWREPEVICYSRPAREVGGDFYTYHPFDAHTFAITVGDISGKGMSAALLMASALAHINAMLNHRIPPSKLLNHLDQELLQYTKSTRQNCALCYLELTMPPLVEVACVRIVNAGGIPPFIKRIDNSVEWPEIGGFALGQGLGSEIGYEQLELSLKPGDMLVLTSDGVAEANDSTDTLLGFDRLQSMIMGGPTDSPQAMLDYLLAEIDRFVGLADPYDDLTIVVIQV